MSHLFYTQVHYPTENKMEESSESRMIIRRDRTRSASSSSQPSDPRNTSVYERLLRKKHSEPTLDGVFEDSENEIECRRRRMRNIRNSSPPKLSSNFRSLSVSTQNALKKKNSNDDKRCSVLDEQAVQEVTEETEDENNNTTDDHSSRRTSRKEWSSKKNSLLHTSSTDAERSLDKMQTEIDKIGSVIESSTYTNGSELESAKYNGDTKNVLNLTIDVRPNEKHIHDPTMDAQLSRTKRSLSLKDGSSAALHSVRKSSHPPMGKGADVYDLNDSLPDLIDTPKTPNNSADRLKRDFHLTNIEIMALRSILKKADLYEQNVRDRMFKVLKIDETKEDDVEKLVGKVIVEKEVDSLKQKLFMSRKELDSYISFTKKMEREKRQSISEKEELETKIQWHERRLTRFESENKGLKTERASLLNQIYELKGKSSSLKEAGHARQKSMDSGLLTHQPELELSKQRLIYEADAFAQERTKLIKERQRLDEEVRKVQIRCVSLLAQLQHSEKTVEELKGEKEQLKSRLSKITRQSHDDARKLHERLANAEIVLNAVSEEKTDRNKNSKDYSLFIETMKQDDTEFSQLQNDLGELEKKYDTLQNEYRNVEEHRIRLDHENMALKDTVNVIQNAKEDALCRLNEMDAKYREALGELKAVTVASENFEQERVHLRQELEDVSSRLAELQHDAVDMEANQDAFKKFLDKLCLELKEKLGDEHENMEAEADTLEERAELVGKQIVQHITPSRKLQEDYEAMKQDKDDLEEEIRYLKFALANRLEIKNLQLPKQNCECSKEKNILKADLEEALVRIDTLDAEVNRLHQDKQQLLMSFLNLQASQRSREVSKSDVGMATDDDLSDDDTETERESDDGLDCRSYSSSTPSINDPKLPNGTESKPVTPYGPSSESQTTATDNPSSWNDKLENLRARLQDAIDAKERLENERAEMLDSLCKQVDNNNSLKAEIEDLKNGAPFARPSSRPGSAISKSDSSTSLSQEKCINCSAYSDEIRSYLSIIEELTEDKLRLEKIVNDLEGDGEQLKTDLERLTQSHCKTKSELAEVGSANDSALKAAKEESQFLLQNIQSLEQENSVLEENLLKLREDKTEILDNLRQAEEDRFGFIRTLQLITEQKVTVEEEVEELKKEIESLKQTSSDRDLSTFNASNLSKEGGDLADVTEAAKMPLSRSMSTPSNSHDDVKTGFKRSVSTALQSPREHPLHRVRSIEDVSDLDENADLHSLQDEVKRLRQQIFSYKSMNNDLKESLQATSAMKEGEAPGRKLPVDYVNSDYITTVSSVNELENENPGLETILENEHAATKIPRQSSDAERQMSDVERRYSDVERRYSDGERRTSDVERRRRGTLERKSSIVLEDDSTPHQKLYGKRKTSLDMLGLGLFEGTTSSVDITSTDENSMKELSFQVSFNGVAVHEQNQL